MIFGYSLEEAQKAVVSLVVLVAAAVALFVVYDPSITTAVIVLVGAVFGVIAVFAQKNHDVDDFSKAVAQLQASAIAVVAFFVTVDPGTVGKISAVVAALIGAYAVYKRPNRIR